MSDDKQKEMLSGYEQLKRKNRRRLVGASGLVLVSGILLAGALYTGADKEPSAETAAASAPVENVAASAEEPEVAIWEPNSSGSARQVPASEAASSARQSADAASADAEAAPAADMKAEEGAPVVLINDTLVDNGTEDRADKPKAASAPRKPETQVARRSEAEEETVIEDTMAEDTADSGAEQPDEAQRAEERRRRLAEQRAAAKRAEREAAVKKQRAEREAAKRRAAKLAAEKRAAERREAEQQAEARKEQQYAVGAAEYRRVEPARTDKPKEQQPVRKAEAKPEAVRPEPKSEARKPAAPTAPTAESKTVAAKGKGGKAAIQAGYPEKERALSLQRKMKAAGINAGILEVNTDKGKVYRVKTGSYPNRAAAEHDLNRMRVHGIGGTVIEE